MSEKLIFSEVLPFPPSVNKYWRMGKTWDGKRVTHLSSEAKKFTHEVAVIIAKKAGTTYSTKRLRGEFILHPKTKARIDIDNRLKGLLDAMQKAYLYADDEQFDEITIRRGSVVKGGNIEVRIWEIGQ